MLMVTTMDDEQKPLDLSIADRAFFGVGMVGFFAGLSHGKARGARAPRRRPKSQCVATGGGSKMTHDLVLTNSC